LKYEYADDDDEVAEEDEDEDQDEDQDENDGRRMSTCNGTRSKYIHVRAHALMSCETNGANVLVLGRQF
jgi:hypothetical protein